MSGRSMYFLVTYFFIYFLGVESLPEMDTSIGIVGGKTVNITEVPYMARYGNPDSFFFCGAAIVQPRYLITTARCFYRMDGNSYVIVGTDKQFTEGEAYDVDAGYPHPGYYPTLTVDHDIAVLKLVETLTFNDRVNSIPLADKNFVIPEGALLDALGFGSTSEVFLKIPKQLQKVSVPYISYAKCKRLERNLTKRMICAGGERKGSCYLDQGGPLVYEGKLLGVLSYAVGCGFKNSPSVYSYVPELREFIDSVIEASS